MIRSFTLFLSMLIIISSTLFAQEIPPDSLYLGQTPPGNIPKVFSLPVSTGSFTAERIAISNDGKEIYYSVVRNYYPIVGDTIKYFKYSGDKWTGPFNQFNGYLAPGLSITGDTLYFQNNIVPYQTLYSVRNGSSWSNPQRILYNLNSAHYFQVTNKGNHFISSISNPSLGASDWCNLTMSNSDTSVISLGVPVCTSGDNLDFYIARDESFIITTSPAGLSVSFNKNNRWTNPKNLGSQINFGLGMWGPFVTSDKKYLFYTTGTNPNYSDTRVHWVRIDSLIDSLMQTNFIPYINCKIPNQTDSVGYSYNYTFPDTTFIDDDGNNTLTYSATLNNGSPLPSWLSFDPSTRTFSGTPTSTGNYFLKVTATDTANAKAFCIFNLKIENPLTSIEDDQQSLNDYKLFQNYPNPFNPTTKISWQSPVSSWQTLKVFNVLGKEVVTLVDEFKPAGSYESEFNAENISSGIYFYVLKTNTFCDQKKMLVLK